ncbi:MAG: hypothetical protein AAF721_13250 [Myxococcota bacterium]
MELKDLDAVVTQYRTLGEGAARRPLAEVTDKLRTMMLDQPSFDGEAPHSLVHEGSDGRIVGFIGVVPRKWKVGDRTLIGATTTGLVVDPEHPDRMLSALWLTRGAHRQGQDFTFVDRPTPTVTKFSASLGGEGYPGHGFNFRLALREHEASRQEFRDRVRYRRWWPAVAAVERAVRPVTAALDNRRPRELPTAAQAAVDLEEATAATLHEARCALSEHYGPILIDDEALAQWQFDYMATYASRGDFRWFVARARGAIVGWVLYYVRDDAPSEVASLVALPNHSAAVSAALIRQAYDDGCSSIFGTVSGAVVHDLLDFGGVVDSTDRVWVQANHRENQALFRTNRTLITGLEGEVWV